MEVDDNPTRQVLPRPSDPCRRCEHPYSEHREENTGCSVEFGKAGRVPNTAFGGVCPCESYVFDPADASEDATESDPELLDGPAMYALARDHMRKLRAKEANRFHRSFAEERHELEHAMLYFAGAQASVLGRLAIDNGNGDLEERRWQAALAGKDLPEGDA